MIIAIDFDGTLCRGTYPNIGGPQPYAVEVMKKLSADGHYLIIWTCRHGELLTKAINWMLDQGIPFNRVNEHNPDNLAKYGGDARKIYAHVYIDDKNLGGLPTWPEIYESVTEMERAYLEKKGEANV